MQRRIRPAEDQEPRERPQDRREEEEYPRPGPDKADKAPHDEVRDRSIGGFSDAQLGGDEDFTGPD